jgi:hypothetical protein
VSAPVCRTCYGTSLPREEAVRFYAEPLTMPAYYCPKHQLRQAEMQRIFEEAVRKGIIVVTGSSKPLRFVPWYDNDAALSTWESEGGR